MATTDIPNRLLNNADVAAKLSINAMMLVNMRDKGESPYVRLNNNAKGSVPWREPAYSQIANREQLSTAANGRNTDESVPRS